MLTMRRVSASDPDIGVLSYVEEGEVGDPIAFLYTLRATECAPSIIQLSVIFTSHDDNDEHAKRAINNAAQGFLSLTEDADNISWRSDGEKPSMTVRKSVHVSRNARLKYVTESLHAIGVWLSDELLRQFNAQEIVPT